MTYNILRFEASDRMSDLVSNYYSMFIVLNRFGINMGFQDQTIGEICENYNIDVKTLLVIVNLLISPDRANIDNSDISLPELINYLKSSHLYYLNYRLPLVRSQLHKVLNDDSLLTKAVLKYYDEYIDETRRHMEFENRVLFKYVEDLLHNQCDSFIDIDNIENHHDNREVMLKELKNIVIKYYPSQMTNELSSVMYEMFVTEDLVSSHCMIEDYLLRPSIKLLEQTKGVKDGE